jgi:hypothetical protein
VVENPVDLIVEVQQHLGEGRVRGHGTHRRFGARHEGG